MQNLILRALTLTLLFILVGGVGCQTAKNSASVSPEFSEAKTDILRLINNCRAVSKTVVAGELGGKIFSNITTVSSEYSDAAIDASFNLRFRLKQHSECVTPESGRSSFTDTDVVFTVPLQKIAFLWGKNFNSNSESHERIAPDILLDISSKDVDKSFTEFKKFTSSGGTNKELSQGIKTKIFAVPIYAPSEEYLRKLAGGLRRVISCLHFQKADLTSDAFKIDHI